MGTGCRHRGMTAMAMPSAARRRATWCRRPRRPRIAPHRIRLVLPSAGPSSPLSCTRSIRRRCTPGAPTGCRLPELLLAVSTRSCCRRFPRPPQPCPRASGPKIGGLSSWLPPPRHRASGSAAPSQKHEDALQTVVGKVKGAANEEEKKEFEDKDYCFTDEWDQLAPPLSDNEHGLSEEEEEEEGETLYRWDLPDACLTDKYARVSSGEEEENFDALQTVVGKVKGAANEEEKKEFEDKDYCFTDEWDQLAPPLSDNEHGLSEEEGEEGETLYRWDLPDACLTDKYARVSSGEEEENFDVTLNIDDIILEDEKIPQWPQDSDYSKSDSPQSDPPDPLDLELEAIRQEHLIRMLKAKEEEEEEERERKKEKRKRKREKKEEGEDGERKRKEERKREREKRKKEKEERKRKREKVKKEEEHQ